MILLFKKIIFKKLRYLEEDVYVGFSIFTPEFTQIHARALYSVLPSNIFTVGNSTICIYLSSYLLANLFSSVFIDHPTYCLYFALLCHSLASLAWHYHLHFVLYILLTILPRRRPINNLR